MAEASRKPAFLALQVLVLAEGVVLLAQGAVEFLAAAAGDATVLFVSGILFLIAGALLYLSIGLRTRGSTPYFATVVACLLAVLLLASFGAITVLRGIGIALAIAVIVALIVLRRRFHLRPGEVVKEEKLSADVLSKVSTRVRGVRCRECGDTDVFITSDRALVCRNCGSLNA